MEATEAIRSISSIIDGAGKIYAAAQGHSVKGAGNNPSTPKTDAAGSKSGDSASEGNAMDKLRKFFQDSGGVVHKADLERFIGNDTELNQAYATLRNKRILADGAGPSAFPDGNYVHFTRQPEEHDMIINGKKTHYTPNQQNVDDIYKTFFSTETPEG